MKILVVDDEAMQRDMLRGFLEKKGYTVLAASDGREALKIFEREPVHLVIMDHKMPGLTGDEVLAKMKAVNPTIRAIMITAYGNVNTAVTVMKLGAEEFFEKPVDLPMLLEKIQQIEQKIAVDEDIAKVEEVLEESALPLKIIARSPAMREVISMARRVAESMFPVLIQGETGTGKELIARLIHLLSSRRDNPFLELNCAAIPENLFESELFGHEKGAFTGAVNRRRGRFELAHGGTLFMDEIGEMPLSVQPKLLRTLQEKRISRVGSEGDITVDARLISATNRDLKKMCEEKRFREDLYFRIKVLEIEIPPLRGRREDIPALVDFFMERYAARSVRLASEALDALIKYPFPGNVRELENVIQRTVTLARGEVIRPADLPEEIRHHQATTKGTLTERLEVLEHKMIIAALEKSHQIQTKAAELLGIGERVLRYKMKKYGIKGTFKK
jgi:DNA-binding NtrC family response regulator